MSETPEERRARLDAVYDELNAQVGRPADQRGRGWWAKLGAVVLASVAAVLLILAGAVRFLDQAERQRAEVECIRGVLRDQALSTSRMAAGVLDLTRTADARRAALQAWVDDQGAFVRRLEVCGG